MKIVVAGGRSKADFLIGSLLEKKHEVTVINDEEAYCRYLSEKYNIPVVVGNPCKRCAGGGGNRSCGHSHSTSPR